MRQWNSHTNKYRCVYGCCFCCYRCCCCFRRYAVSSQSELSQSSSLPTSGRSSAQPFCLFRLIEIVSIVLIVAYSRIRRNACPTNKTNHFIAVLSVVSVLAVCRVICRCIFISTICSHQQNTNPFSLFPSSYENSQSYFPLFIFIFSFELNVKFNFIQSFPENVCRDFDLNWIKLPKFLSCVENALVCRILNLICWR